MIVGREAKRGGLDALFPTGDRTYASRTKSGSFLVTLIAEVVSR